MTENLDEDESSKDREKTQIFLNLKLKPYLKPNINKTKGTISKTNPPKETTTSIVGPSDKGGKDLDNLDDKAQDE